MAQPIEEVKQALFQFTHFNIPLDLTNRIKEANKGMTLEEDEFQAELETEDRIKKLFYSYSGKDHLYDLAPLDAHVHIDTHRESLVRQFVSINQEIEVNHGLPLQLLISREDKVSTCQEIF